MITKFYKWMAAGTVTSLLLATLAVAPVSAQSSSGNGQGSDQNQGQGMNQGNNQNGNSQNQSSQNPGQGSCAAFAQSMGQGMNQSSNQNGQSGNNSQAALATSPSNAATPMANCWLSIGPGQKQWYKFHVGARSNKGDENNNFDNANGIDDSDAAIAELTMDTQGCIAFEIWTQERLNAAQNGVKDDDKLLGPVGAGSPEFAINHNNDNSSDDNSSSNNSSSANSDKNLNRSRLLWRGGSTVREDFLLVVRNLRSDFACSYRLSVAGPTVSFPNANNGGNNAANGSNNGNNGSNNNNGNNGGNNSSNNNDSNGGNSGSNNNNG